MSGRMYAMIPGSDNDDRSLEHVFARWTEKVINIENIINIDVPMKNTATLLLSFKKLGSMGLNQNRSGRKSVKLLLPILQGFYRETEPNSMLSSHYYSPSSNL
jgi:hypothetical protein